MNNQNNPFDCHRSQDPQLPHDDQVAACRLFLDTLVQLDPASAAAGDAYVGGMGCLPQGWKAGAAYRLRADDCRPLARRICLDAKALRMMVDAGLMKQAVDGKPACLVWWDYTVLLPCLDEQGEPAYLAGKRRWWTPGDRYGQYINQMTRRPSGAVRLPFNLPALYKAAGRLDRWPWSPAPGKEGELLVVEGALDALAAASLGWAAVAVLGRPQARGFTDRTSSDVRMLEPHLPAMRDLSMVRVVPNSHPGDKGAEGVAMAGRLGGWLRAGGVMADISSLEELVPEAAGCKDLAEYAETLAKGNDR